MTWFKPIKDSIIISAGTEESDLTSSYFINIPVRRKIYLDDLPNDIEQGEQVYVNLDDKFVNKYINSSLQEVTDNYSAFDKFVPEEILANPDLVATKYPLMSAAWFFNKNGLWAICDKGADQGTVTAVTKRVNGGTIGLPDRIKHFNEYYNLLK